MHDTYNIPVRDLLRATAAEPTPCDGCWNFNTCKTTGVSCGDFFVWVNHKRVTCEQRIPSRLWSLRLQRCDENDGGTDITTEAFAHYWQGVSTGVSLRRSAAPRERVLKDAMSQRPVFEDQFAFMCGVRDADDRKITNVSRWRDENVAVGSLGNSNRQQALGIEKVSGLVMAPKTPAEVAAVKVSKAHCPQALFLEPDKTVTVVDADHIKTQRRIDMDARSLIGVYAPSCPPEWIVSDVERLVR